MHVISRRARQPGSARRRRVGAGVAAAAPPRRRAVRRRSAVGSCRSSPSSWRSCATSSASRACCSSTCSRSSSSRRSAAPGPALGAAVAAFLLVNWYFTPPLYTFTIGETENLLALAVFLVVAATVSALRLARGRGARQRAARARAEAEALARLAGSLVASTRSVLDERSGRAFALDGVTLLAPRRRRRLDASQASARPPSADAGDARSCRSTTTHELALGGPRAPGRRAARARRLRRASSRLASQLEELAGRGRPRPASSSGRTTCGPRSSRRSRTTFARRSPAIKASVTSLLQRRRRVVAEATQRVPRDDRRGDRPAQRARRQPARHEPAPDRRARRSTPRRSALDEVVPAALAQPRRARRTRSRSTSPRRCPASRPTRACSSAPSRTSSSNALAARRGGRGVRLDGRRRRRRRRPARRRSRPRHPARASRADVRAVPAARRRPRDGGVGLGLAVARGFVEAMGGEVEVEDTPGRRAHARASAARRLQ